MQRAFDELGWIDVSFGDTQVVKKHPQPQALFLEAGIVLGTTLGFVFAVDLLLILLNVPSP